MRSCIPDRRTHTVIITKKKLKKVSFFLNICPSCHRSFEQKISSRNPYSNWTKYYQNQRKNKSQLAYGFNI